MSKVYFSCGDSANNEFDVGYNFVRKSTLRENYPWLVDSQVGGSVLWVWGRGADGRLGDGSTITKSSPVQTISFGTNWKCVAAGSYHGMATKTDGTLWIWGLNSNGELGNTSTIPRSSPVQTTGGGTNWKQISAACCHSSGIKNDGTLWMWGGNAGGRLGDNSTSGNLNRSSPVQVTGAATTWKFAAICGRMSTALKTDGTLWTWGCNVCGGLGISLAFATTPGRSSPVQTTGGGTNWTKISTSGYAVGAIKTDGSLWMWGNNAQGVLGDNSTIDKSSPVQVFGTNTGWKTISVSRCASLATCGSKSQLIGWGSDFGALNGYSSIGPVYVPRSTMFATPFVEVSSGRCTIHAITPEGALLSWGYNCAGQLGNNKQNNNTYGSPVQVVMGGNNWRTVSGGLNFVMAIQDINDE